jgi:hypothetical protein
MSVFASKNDIEIVHKRMNGFLTRAEVTSFENRIEPILE